MEIIVFLSIVIAVLAVLTSIVLVRRVKKQIAEMTDVLVDVKNGNGNRRILSATNELTAPLAYEINEIVVSYESRLSTVRQTEETNRQLMTSLSHDVRTPLTTLIGYPSDSFVFSAFGYALHIRDELVADAFASLPEREQSILILYCVLELTDGEIGSIAEMSRSAVQRHRTKALNELRKRLEDDGGRKAK